MSGLHLFPSKNSFILWMMPVVFLIQACQKDSIIWTKATSRGPYVQMVGPTQATINWRTHYEIDGTIKLGLTPAQQTIEASDSKGYNHSVTVTGLTPSTKYYYSLWSGNHKMEGDSTYYFITSPTPGTERKTRIWVTGDAGTGLRAQNEVRDALIHFDANRKPDLWLWLGDNAYNSGTDKEYQNNVFIQHYEELMKTICVWPTIGNHDFSNSDYQSVTSRTNRFPYYDIFSLPTNGEIGGQPSGKENYYSFDYGTIHFICLDSYASYNDAQSDMYQWLEKDLQSTQQKWKIVFFHHPPYAKGTHNSDTEPEMIDMRTHIVPLLERYGTDLVLGGHSHSYERSYLLKGHVGPENTLSATMILNNGSGKDPAPYTKTSPGYEGTVYAVVGCSGKHGGSSIPGYPHNAMYYSNKSIDGAMIIDIENNTLHATFIDANRSILDQFTIQKY